MMDKISGAWEWGIVREEKGLVIGIRGEEDKKEEGVEMGG